MRYEFKTANGSLCCQSDDKATLCPACRLRERAGVPPAPTLAASIRQNRQPAPLTITEHHRMVEQNQLLVHEYFAAPRLMADGTWL